LKRIGQSQQRHQQAELNQISFSFHGFALTSEIQTPNAPNVHRKMILAAAFVPSGQPEISQTQGGWVLAHGDHPSQTKSVRKGAQPSRLPFSASRRKPVNQLICPTMFRARRPKLHARRVRPPNHPSQNDVASSLWLDRIRPQAERYNL
jgi:hypothetical protein